MQCFLADIGNVSRPFFPLLYQILETDRVIFRPGQSFQKLLDVAETTPARGRFEAGIEIVGDGYGVAHCPLATACIRRTHSMISALIARIISSAESLCGLQSSHFDDLNLSATICFANA